MTTTSSRSSIASWKSVKAARRGRRRRFGRRWPVSLELLGYRRWRGRLGSSLRAIWPVARVGLKMVFRQKLFWVLYGLALMTFLINFFGIYLFSQIDTQMLAAQNRPG